MLKSYPKGAQCICGKSDWDFGNTNAIAKHLLLNPKHYIKMVESAAHRESVKNKIHSQRIRRLIQTGSQIEPKQFPRNSDVPPLTCVKNAARKSAEISVSEDSDMETQPEADLLQSNLMKLLKLKVRVPQKQQSFVIAHESHSRPKFKISASGVDLETAIKSRECKIEGISGKDRRRITSVLHNANVERTKKLQAIQIQQQQNQQALQKQLQRQNQNRTLSHNTNPRTNQYSQNTNPQYLSTLSQPKRTYMGQKRSAPSTPPVQPARKMSNQMLQFRQKMIPIKPSGVKFPVVTHKEIQVEIIPSEDAKLRNNIDKYEIEFKGRKTPNKYNVKPNIKIVKLIGLQSDTEYLIKVFAIRNNVRSEPVMKRVKTTPLPRGNNTAVVSDVIELD